MNLWQYYSVNETQICANRHEMGATVHCASVSDLPLNQTRPQLQARWKADTYKTTVISVAYSMRCSCLVSLCVDP